METDLFQITAVIVMAQFMRHLALNLHKYNRLILTECLGDQQLIMISTIQIVYQGQISNNDAIKGF